MFVVLKFKTRKKFMTKNKKYKLYHVTANQVQNLAVGGNRPFCPLPNIALYEDRLNVQIFLGWTKRATCWSFSATKDACEKVENVTVTKYHCRSCRDLYCLGAPARNCYFDGCKYTKCTHAEHNYTCWSSRCLTPREWKA